MAFGLDSNGLTIKTLDIIEEEVKSDLLSIPGITNVSAEKITGQFNGIYSERLALLWELLESIHKSQYPDSAEGSSLAEVGSLTLNSFLKALPSTVQGQILIGTPATVVPAGTLFSVAQEPTKIFTSLSEAILGTGTDEIQDIDFDAVPVSGVFKVGYKTFTTNNINWNDTNATVQTELRLLSGLEDVTVVGNFTAGFTVTFTGVAGLRPETLLTISSNTLQSGVPAPVIVSVAATTPGVYQAQVDLNAVNTGIITASAGTVTVIDTPVSGLDSVLNPFDVIPGRDVETDTEFRARRLQNLQITRSGPTLAIRKAILELNDIPNSVQIDSVKVFENFTSAVDARSIPPKAIMAVVSQVGNSTTRDQEISQSIFDSKAGGIEPFGDISKTIIDAEGITHTVKFKRPIDIPIYLILNLTVDASYPATGDNEVKNLIKTWGDSLGVGVNVVVYPTLIGQLIEDNIKGIIDIVIKIGKAPTPTLDNNIMIDDGLTAQVERSTWDVANMTVTS